MLRKATYRNTSTARLFRNAGSTKLEQNQFQATEARRLNGRYRLLAALTQVNLVNKVVKVVPDVDQRLGFSKTAFDRIGLPAREVPVCKKSYN